MSESTPKESQQESHHEDLGPAEYTQYALSARDTERRVSILSRDMELLSRHWDDPSARQAYEKCRVKLDTLRTGFEALTKHVQDQGPMPHQVLPIREHLAKLFYDAAQAAATVEDIERTRLLHEYEKEVRNIAEEVKGIEYAFKVGDKNSNTREALHRRLEDVQEKLQNLDEGYKDHHIHPEKSLDRKKLILLINLLREWHPVRRSSVPVTEARPPKSANLTVAINMHQQVRDAYAKISHTLSEGQRRVFRVRIAKLSALVKTARHEHIHTTATLAVSRATELAPALMWEATRKRS